MCMTWSIVLVRRHNLHGCILVYCVILPWSGWMPIYCHLDEVPCHFVFKTKVMFSSAPIITGKVGFNPASWSFFPLMNYIVCWLFHLETASECLFEFGMFTLWPVTYNWCIIWWYYGNQPVTVKIFFFDNYMFTHEEFRFHRCPFHYTGTLLSMYPSMKVQ
jgi:hypothetical protein